MKTCVLLHYRRGFSLEWAIAILMEDDGLPSGAVRAFIEPPEAHCDTGGDSGGWR